MKHSGKARKAAFKMLLITLLLVVLVPVAGLLATFIGISLLAIFWILLAVWFVFALFTLYLFPRSDCACSGGTESCSVARTRQGGRY